MLALVPSPQRGLQVIRRPASSAHLPSGNATADRARSRVATDSQTAFDTIIPVLPARVTPRTGGEAITLFYINVNDSTVLCVLLCRFALAPFEPRQGESRTFPCALS